MTAPALIHQKYTLEEYLHQEEKAAAKHFFENGKIIPMPGGTAKHNEISANAITALAIAVRTLQNKFRVYSSDMKIWIPKRNAVLYPDALVIAQSPVFYGSRKDIIINPLLIVEVLSPGTEDYDRGSKFIDYCTIPTFQEYLLLRQDEALAHLATRQSEDTWRMSDYTGLEASIRLESIACSIQMADLYYNIDFAEAE